MYCVIWIATDEVEDLEAESGYAIIGTVQSKDKSTDKEKWGYSKAASSAAYSKVTVCHNCCLNNISI